MTGGANAALRVLIQQDDKWDTIQKDERDRIGKNSAPTHATYDRYHAGSLAWDLDLFALARRAVDTWRPGAPPLGLVGAGTYLLALTRAVAAVEAVDPAGQFTQLKTRFAASVQQWRAVRASGAGASGYDSTFTQMSADDDARMKVFGDLEAAVHNYAAHLQEQNVDSLIASFEELARTNPGGSGRISIEVLGSDGHVTVVRDDVIKGPAAAS